MGSVNPLQYFEDLVEEDRTVELKESFISMCIEHLGSDITEINKELGKVYFIVTASSDVSDKTLGETSSYSFDTHFRTKINEEYKKAKKCIDKMVVQNSLEGQVSDEFLNRQISNLKLLCLKADKLYPNKYTQIINSALIPIDNYIRDVFEIEAVPLNKSQNTFFIADPSDYSELSFCWDAIDNEIRKEHLTKLYNRLTEQPPIVDCTKEDFINAFSQMKINSGVKWLVKGKNRQISKVALFHFINKLMDDEFIHKVPSTNLSRRIKYVFRDGNGNRLDNLRQSKNMLTKPF